MEVQAWQKAIGEWQRKTFGGADGLERAKPLLSHLKQEVHELMLELYASEINQENLSSEMADVFILLVAMADRLQIDLDSAILRKMNINMSRTWGEPDGDGVVRHIG